MSSSSSSSPAPPRSSTSKSLGTGEGGSSASSSRSPQNVTRDKITKAWPSLLADDKKDDLNQIVLDHMSGAILYDSFFGHIVNPATLTIAEERTAFTTYLAECHGYMPVKLVISALPGVEEGGLTTLMRRGYSQMLGITYGLSHIDILVGDMLVGWFDNELVGIRKLGESDPMLRRTVAVFDLHAGIKAAGAEQWLNQLCALIATWNSQYRYNRNYTKAADVHGAKLANCQGFANWIMREMKLEDMRVQLRDGTEVVQPVLSVAMNEFMTNFVANPGTWEQYLKLHGEVIPTTSHAEFDNWVTNKYQKGQEAKKPMDGAEFDLLKGIDRGMWMRYHANTQFLANQRASPDPTDAAELKKKNDKMVVARAAIDRYIPRCHHFPDGSAQKVCPFGNPLAAEPRIVELIPYDVASYALPAAPTATRCIIQ